jgi:biopolymer transport protein ExbD
LLFFINSLPPVTHAVKIDNPLPREEPPRSPPIVVNLPIDFDGTLSWNGRAVNRKIMQGSISEQACDNPQPEVHISVDKFAKYEKVVETLADLQSRGVKKSDSSTTTCFRDDIGVCQDINSVKSCWMALELTGSWH